MCIETSIQSKFSFPCTNAYFSFTSISLNDVSVRGGNVIKPLTGEIGTGQKFVSLKQLKGK